MNPKAGSHLFTAVLAVLATGLTTQTHAAGFQLVENSASGQGNAFAGAAAAAEDASTVWFNPAGMMKLKGNQIVVAGHFISPDAAFTNKGSTNANGSLISGAVDDGGKDAFVPNFYWVTGLNEKMKFGLAVTVPFGLETEYNDTWVGRYHAIKTDLKTLNFNPSIAYKVNDKLSVGGGLNIMFASVTITNAIDFGALQGSPNTDDGFLELTGDNFSSPGYAFNLGLLYDITKATSVGVAYRSETKISVEGDAVFRGSAAATTISNATGAFKNTGLAGDITLPSSVSVSFVHTAGKLKYLTDITWTGWRSFDELRIRFDNPAQPDGVTTEAWQNTIRLSAGVDWQYSNRLTLRTGVAYDETPVPSDERRTARIPGNNRTWLSFGGTYILNDAFTVDVGYSHLFISDTNIDNTFESSQPALAATLKGTYEASVDILSAQLRWNY